jgi:hypothetical protein
MECPDYKIARFGSNGRDFAYDCEQRKDFIRVPKDPTNWLINDNLNSKPEKDLEWIPCPIPGCKTSYLLKPR